MSTTRTRLAPAQRREQLLDLGVQLLSVRRLEDLSVDLLAEEAGISRGLLYHYFADKREFHLAILQRMADKVVTITQPVAGLPPMEQLAGSLDAFVDFVVENRDAYASFVRAAAAGDAAYQRIYEDARDALTDRIFSGTDPRAMSELGMVDSPALRLMVSGWSSMVEDVLLTWLDDDHGVTKDELLRLLAGSLATIGSIVTATR